MYYATYEGIGDSDIAAFRDKRERDDWVNFKDPYSKALGMTSDNCTFKRIPLKRVKAEKRIKTMLHIKDEFNINQEWYVI